MNRKITVNVSPRLMKLFTIIIILMQPLNVYSSFIPNVALGELLMVLAIPMLVLGAIIQQNKLRISSFVIYLIYTFMISAIISLLTDIGDFESVKRLIRDTFYWTLFLFFGLNYFNYEYGVNLYKFIAKALSIYIIFQFIIYQLSGYYLTGFVPFLDINTTGNVSSFELISHYLKSASNNGYLRPNGFLLEPAACGQYLAPVLILYLFKSNNELSCKYEYKNILIITVGMLLTVSANAYISLFFIYIIWIISNFRKKKISKKLLGVIAIIIVTGVIFLTFTNIGRSVINRFIILLSNQQREGSSSIRVLRGMAFYLAMPVQFQIFGIGFGNFIQFKAAYNIETIYETMDEYMNTNAYILISVGIVGFLLYLFFIFRFTKNKYFQSKALVYLLLLFGLSCSIYSTPIFILILLLIYHTPCKYNMVQKINID